MVDEKRRMAIPAQWSQIEAAETIVLVLWPGSKAGACIRGVKRGGLEKMADEIDAVPNTDPKKAILKRQVFGRSAELALDKVRRVTLPGWMAEAAGITTQAVLLGCGDRFEVWSPGRAKSLDEVEAEQMPEALAIMG